MVVALLLASGSPRLPRWSLAATAVGPQLLPRLLSQLAGSKPQPEFDRRGHGSQRSQDPVVHPGETMPLACVEPHDVARRRATVPCRLEDDTTSEAAKSRQQDSSADPRWLAQRSRSEPPVSAELRAPVINRKRELAGLNVGGELRPVAAVQTVLAGQAAAHAARRGGSNRGGSSSVTRAQLAEPMHRSAEDTGGASAYVGDRPRAAGRGFEPVRRCRHGLGGGWPETPQLDHQLQQAAVALNRLADHSKLVSLSSDELADADASDDSAVSGFAAWQDDVRDQLDRLRQLPSITAGPSRDILGQLAALADQGEEAAEALDDRAAQVEYLRAVHALRRRVVVWGAVHQATLAAQLPVSKHPHDDRFDGPAIHSLAEVVAEDAGAMRDAEAWRDYLLLDELTAAADSNDERQRQLVAQRLLWRLNWSGLTPLQRRWLQRPSVDALAAAVRPWSVGPVDYAALLGQLERQESDAIDSAAIDVAKAAQSLRFASSADAAQLATALDHQYRNANIRVAVSGQWINRLIPDIDARVETIRQRMLGADVRGHSHIESAVNVELVPSGDRWRLNLQAEGHVHSDTASRNGPVSIRSGSLARFHSTTPLQLTRHHAGATNTQVSVDSQMRVRGIDTDYDGVPLLRELIREIAWNRYQSLAPTAKRIQHYQIAGSVGSEIDERVRDQLDEASAKFARHVTGPLHQLGLRPTVIDMQTTEDRLLARYRVGGPWQLAAFTPRPRAYSNSLLSIQLHQSVFNNTLEAVLPADRSTTISQLSQQVGEHFGIESWLEPDEEVDEVAQDATVYFVSNRPVSIEMKDDRVWVTLRINRLHHPGSVDLRRFIVRVAYRAEVDGAEARLVRDGHLRISGPGMSLRDRLPIRAVFNKVFSSSRSLPLVPPRLARLPAMQGLRVSQLELRDGWIALALAADGEPVEVDAARTARLP